VGTDEFSVIVLTFGISIAIESTLTLIYGSSNRFATVGLPTGRINWAGFQFSWLDVAAAACAVIGVVAILALMRFTRWGVDSRALAENPSLAADFGIRTGAVGAVAWALGTGAAALAGIVYGATTNVSLSLADVGLVTLPGIMLGGMDSVGGALVGGVVMGVLISLVTYVGGPDVATIAGYGALLVVLIFLPQGLFGLRRSRVV
jgi:branched-chain amino acid transport system permease protein